MCFSCDITVMKYFCFPNTILVLNVTMNSVAILETVLFENSSFHNSGSNYL